MTICVIYQGIYYGNHKCVFVSPVIIFSPRLAVMEDLIQDNKMEDTR